MAMANMNLLGVFVTKLWPVQGTSVGVRRRRRRRRCNQKHNITEIFGDIIKSYVGHRSNV